jgi:hypothetical protein
MAENERGYHHPRQHNFPDEHMRGQGRMEPDTKGRAGMREPTNHGGHTHEMARVHEHNARVESMRSMHAGVGQREHEKILHDTHKLHQGNEFTSHGNKHGAAHHWREGSAAEERGESRAEREREGD